MGTSYGFISATITPADIQAARERIGQMANQAMDAKQDGIFYHLGHAFDCEDCGILQAHLRKLKAKNKKLKRRLRSG